MSENLEQIFGRAVQYYLSDNLDKAKKNCQKILKKIPGHPDTNALMASIYQKLGQQEIAVSYIQKAVNAQPDYAQGWYILGQISNEQQQFENARDAYFKVVELEPDHPEAWYGLGNAYFDLDEAENAREAYIKALSLNPDLDRAHSNLGSLYVSLGKVDEGLKYYEKAAELNPTNALVHYGLGILHTRLQRWDDALVAFKKAAHYKPDFIKVHIEVAKALSAQSRHQTAVAAYQSALDLEPDSPNILVALADSLSKSNDDAQALDVIEKALALEPENNQAYSTQGAIYASIGLQDKAYAAHEKAILYATDSPGAHLRYGTTLQTFGELDKAEAEFIKAIELAPERATNAFRQLVYMKKFKAHDETSRRMVDIYDKEDLPWEEKKDLAFALAHLHENIGDYDQAFRYLSEGNQLKRNFIEYSTEKAMKGFEAIRRTFEDVRQRGLSQHSPLASKLQPIFILGMPRSATTLTEQILASHPAVSAGGELAYFTDSMHQGSDPGLRRPVIQQTDEEILGIGDKYLTLLEQHNNGKPIVTDKMPHNFINVGLIKTVLPHAKIIHCMRNPVDNCLAIFKQDFQGAHNYCYNLQELGEYYLLYQDLMAYWHEQFPGEIYDTRYEQLVDDQEAQTRKLLEFCELPWDDNCLQFHKTKRAVKTASVTQVRKPIYRDSLSLADRYGQHLNPLREALGIDNYAISK